MCDRQLPELKNLPRGNGKMQPDEKRAVRFIMPSELAAAVKVVAAQRGVSQAAIIRAALVRGLEAL